MNKTLKNIITLSALLTSMSFIGCTKLSQEASRDIGMMEDSLTIYKFESGTNSEFQNKAKGYFQRRANYWVNKSIIADKNNESVSAGAYRGFAKAYNDRLNNPDYFNQIDIER